MELLKNRLKLRGIKEKEKSDGRLSEVKFLKTEAHIQDNCMNIICSLTAPGF